MGDSKKKDNDDFKCKTYELVPPDGGWGYMVAIATIINFTTTTAFVGCFGMLYNDFIIETGMNSASVTLLTGILCMAYALAGFFTSALLTLMSKRKLAFVAAVLYSLGSFGTVIMETPFMFLISVGIMQGSGLGIFFNLSCTIMNEYFLNKKVLVMNFVQTLTGLFTMIAPLFAEWSLEKFGSRGTLLLIAGISLNNFFSACIMQPVEWHMKKVEVPEKELLLEEHKNKKELEYKVKNVETPVVTLTDLEGTIKKLSLVQTIEFDKEVKKKCGIRKILEALIDPSLFKSYFLSCTSIGPAMSVSADSIFMVMVPAYLYKMGWSQANVAMALTSYGFGDLAMRVIFTITSKWITRLGSQEIYVAGIAIAVVSRLGMLWSSSVTAMLVCFSLIGVSHCSIVVLIPVVVSDAVAPEKFTSAMGICILFVGILSIGLGPAVGAVRDVTNSYSYAFYALTSFYAIIVILWPIELFIKKQRRKANALSKSSQLNKVPE